MIGVRKLLSDGLTETYFQKLHLIYLDPPPIQSVINANLIPRMIEFIQIKDEPQLQVRI